MLYPGLFHLAEGSRTRPLLSIPGEQISTLYAFTLHPGGAGHTLHGRLSQSLRPLLSISGAQISMLHSRLYHPSRGSRSYTVWTIKPMIKIRVTHLPQPTSSTAEPNPRNPRNPPQKRAKFSTARAKHKQISTSVPYQSRYYPPQGSRSQCFTHALIIHPGGADHILNG